jgi:hypothetical protein
VLQSRFLVIVGEDRFGAMPTCRNSTWKGQIMKKLLLASVAILALGAGPSFAQNNDAGTAVGGAAGGVGGAVAGGLIFGPIGAAIGGFTGAVLGANAAVDDDTVEYVRMHPTDPVAIEGDVDVGYVVPESVTIHRIEGDSDHGYFYTNDRVWIVDMSNRSVIYSPGTVVAEKKD